MAGAVSCVDSFTNQLLALRLERTSPTMATQGPLVVSTAINDLPRSMRRGIKLMRKRQREFSSELEMQLAGIAVIPEARRYLESKLDRIWAKTTVVDGADYDEVVIGTGPHGAMYAQARAQKGYAPPLVIDRAARMGGIMAVSELAAFGLNSRNRPGRTGLPSENRALNYIPGAPLQLSSMSAGEFQSNADLAFVIRLMLAMSARVCRDEVVGVLSPGASNRKLLVRLASGRRVYTDRVIDARGLGQPKTQCPPGQRLMNFVQLLERMSTDFPLRGMERVAIIGGGDSAKCAAEMLLGAGPSEHSSVAALDFVRQVDIYATDLSDTCDAWRSSERGRYQALGSFLRPVVNGEQRMRVFDQRGVVAEGMDVVFVNERPYDYAIDATGWTLPVLSGSIYEGDSSIYGTRGLNLARVFGASVFQVGPAAKLPFSEAEQQLSTVSTNANKVALFRLAQRTAALGLTLPGKPAPEPALPRPRIKLDRRPVLGTGRDGVQLRAGDRVVFEPEGSRLKRAVGAVVVASRDDDPFGYAIQRDDGAKGDYGDGAWRIVNSKVQGTVQLIEDAAMDAAMIEPVVIS